MLQLTPWAASGMEREDFLASTWDRAPAHHRPEAELPFASVPELLDALADVYAPTDHVDVKGLFGYLPRSAYDLDGTIDIARIRPLVLEQGHALVLRGLHAWTPWVAEISAAWGRQTGALIRSNLYITSGGTRAYPLHWDTHGLTAFQLVGTKQWDLFAPVHEHPLPGQTLDSLELDPGTPVRTVHLSPGETLYVPRGWGHEVRTTSPSSMHLTLGFHLLTRHDLLEIAAREALARLAADPEMRAYASPEDDAGTLSARFTDALRDSLAAQASGLPEGPAAPAAWQLTRPFYLVRQPLQDRVQVWTGLPKQDVHRHLELPSQAEPLLRALSRKGGLTDDEALALHPDALDMLPTLAVGGLVRQEVP